MTQTYSLRLIPPTSPQWDQCLKLAPHDVYHTAAYHRFWDAEGFGTAQLAVFGTPFKFIAWPYLVRRIEPIKPCNEKLRDLTSVYGYSGPIAVGCMSDDAFFGSAWAAFIKNWQSAAMVTVFTRFHPILNTHRWLDKIGASKACPRISPGLQRIGSTIAVDLTASPKQTWSCYKPALRHRIQHGRQAGLVTTHDTEFRHIDIFTELYHQTMHRNHAARFYYFSSRSLTRLVEFLAPNAHLFLTQLNGNVICGGLFFEYAGIVTAHLVGWDYNYRRLSPVKVLYDDIRCWAHERGNRVFHLGGGRGGKDDDPLFVFKSEFSPSRQDYFIGRSILRPDLYRSLLAERTNMAKTASAANPDQGFFPAYRVTLLEENSPRQWVDMGEGYE